VHTVVVRFHHVGRELDEIENDLVDAGAGGARITGYTVAMTLDAGSRDEACEIARRLMDGIGATRIKITKHGARYARESLGESLLAGEA
jgi:hypothetical protein